MSKTLSPKGTPAGKRSELWEYEREIRRLLGEQWSYLQIAEALAEAGVTVSVRWLRRWSLAHIGPVRHRRSAGETAVLPPTPPTASAAPAPLADGRSMAELLAGAEAAARPRKTPRRPTPGAGSISAAIDKLTK